MVIKMFDAFPSAPTKAKLLAMAVFLDSCGYGAFMPQEMRDALQQNIHNEASSYSEESRSPTSLGLRSVRSSSVADSDVIDTTSTSSLAASTLSKKADEVSDAKLECREELSQLYKTAVRYAVYFNPDFVLLMAKRSAINKEEAVSKSIFANILQMHSWSKENDSLFSGTDLGVVLNKVMLTFVAATKSSRSTLVVG